MLMTQDARALVLRAVKPGRTEVVPLAQLHRRVIARPLIAECDLPRFDCSAVDGYAVRASDVASATAECTRELDVHAQVAAGDIYCGTLSPGEAIRVFTGAPVPAGADAVVMQEFTHVRNGSVHIHRAVSMGENIHPCGRECRAGSVVLPAGTRLNAAGIGLMVALGVAECEVTVLPKVALLTTGNEVVEPGASRRDGQIYNANRWTVTCTLDELGLQPFYVSHVSDEPAAIRDALKDALGVADVIITTGGVSVGSADHVKPALRALDVNLHFETVAMKPGKPTCFGTRGTQVVFGLPGNPVAVLVAFHHFVKPAVRRMMGESSAEPITQTARLTTKLVKSHDREEWVRGKLRYENEELQVVSTKGQESYMLSGMATADCLIHFPRHRMSLDAGSIVDIELL